MRSSSGPSRSRGGIQKRRTGPSAVRDRDGDLEMVAGAPRGAKSGKGGLAAAPSGPRAETGRRRGGLSRAVARGLNTPHKNIHNVHSTPSYSQLKVTGLSQSKAATNADGGLDALINFLERKAAGLDSKSNRKVRIKKSLVEGDSVIITASTDDILEMVKLNGFNFAGANLTIEATHIEKELSPEEQAQKTLEVKSRFQQILADRYDVNTKLLNLSALDRDPVLIELGKGVVNTSKIFPALMAICDSLFKSWKEKRDAIVSVRLSDNSLDTLYLVNALAVRLPNIKNLDLSDNLLAKSDSLKAFKGKLRDLENLVLSNNPIETNEPNFKDAVMKMFPKLLILNGIQVRSAEQVAALHAAANSPIPVNGGDFRDVGGVGENFIRQFFTLYDSDRNALLSTFYDRESVFSVSVNTTAARDREHSSAIPAWTSYMKYSRNHQKIKNPGARQNRNHQGLQTIKPVWSELPATKHPDLTTEVDKYIFECRPQPGLPDPSGQSAGGVDGLLVTVHGEFEEQNPTVTDRALRSFSRTFILGPGGPDSPPIRVISDMMTLRAHSPLAKISQPAPQPIPQQAAPQITNNIVPTPEQQKEMVLKQLMDATRMTAEYALMCLTETGGDYQKALAAFEASRVNLPPNAFQ